MKDMNSASGSKVAKAIDNRIITIARQVCKNAPFDSIVRGFVVGIENKKYKVRVRNSVYSIYSLVLPYTISKNDEVLCVVPNNNYSDMFILGKLDT